MDFIPDGFENPGTGWHVAWIWNCPPDRTDERRSVVPQLRDAVSGSAKAGTGRLHHFGMGSFGQQSKGEVLPTHSSWPQTDREGNPGMGANDGHSGSLLESPNRVRNRYPIGKELLSFVPMAYPYLCGSKKTSNSYDYEKTS